MSVTSPSTGLEPDPAAGRGEVPVSTLEQPVDFSAMWSGLPIELARRSDVIPSQVRATGIDLLTASNPREDLETDLIFALDRPVRLQSVDSQTLRNAQTHAIPGSTTSRPEAGALSVESSLGEIFTLAEQPSVVAFLEAVIAQGVRDRASDLHFEPFEDQFVIRRRIDGVLHDLPPPPPDLALPIASRIKVLANLDIANRRTAQDGRIHTVVDGRTIDLRVSTLPTQFGESIVLRVLDPGAVQRDLGRLGMPADVLASVADVIARRSGICIVTGPTGSGKTTTLYACLRALNTGDVKILTAEDPVEYEIEGVIQVPVNPAAGLTFAAALRSFLRQDPDVIMVGEIRDRETAQIAIQAALTGHLVIATLHTNDAVGAVTRLIDMGVEPFLIASTLEGVLAQRLVRRSCVEGHASGATGEGCTQCANTGFVGRIGLYEFLRLDDELRELITRGESTETIRQHALARGLRSLREDADRAVDAGLTTLEEVLRHI